MAEKYELDRWAAVVCNGFTAVNVMSSGNVEELGWDYTEGPGRASRLLRPHWGRLELRPDLLLPA